MISIIITNYNKEKFIEKTLKSCISQSNPNFEIILFDDRSTDKSLMIAHKVLNNSKHKNFKILSRSEDKSKHNSFNQMSAVKTCLNHCNGKYISLLDGDDIFSQNKIKKIFELMKQNKKIIYNSYKILKYKKHIDNKRHFKLRKLMWPVFPPTSCLTIEKDLLVELSNKIFMHKYSTCWLDFRIATYASKFLKKEILYDRETLTTYVHNDESADQEYIKFYKNLFWKRKLQAVKFYHEIIK